MELIKGTCKDGIYQLEFQEDAENTVLKIWITFNIHWSLTDYKKRNNLLGDLGGAVGFYQTGTSVPFPYDVRTNMKTLPVHIPHAIGRQLFKLCFDFFIKWTDAPVHVSTADHPGYPLMMVAYDNSIVLREDTMTGWVESIMRGIQKCYFETELMEKKKDEEEDDIDKVDEDVHVEFELDDPELVSLMKQPAVRTIQPMEGDENND